MNVLPFIPKDDPALPDCYTMKVFFHDGKQSLDLEVVVHRIVCDSTLIEYVTKEDVWGYLPLTSIKRIEFDKRFSQVLYIRAKEQAAKQAAKDAKKQE